MFLSIPVLIIILVVLFLASVFFSASETALVAINKIRLRHFIAAKKRHAQTVQNLITHLDRIITAVLIGNNFVNIAISAIVTVIFVGIFGVRWGVVISTFCVSFFILIVCEITPKIFATQYAEKVSFIIAPLMSSYLRTLKPIINIFIKISRGIIRVFGGKPAKRLPLITEEELRLMIEVGKEEGVLTDEERRMLHRIFEFGDIKVSDVMIPRRDMVCVDIKADLDRLLDIFVEKGFSRVPVYGDNIDDIKGIVYADRILYLIKNKQLFVLEDLMDIAYFVLPLKKVSELLRDFQQRRIRIAIVVDEYKKVLGLVTLEDLLEEIVGEIEEEVIDKD